MTPKPVIDIHCHPSLKMYLFNKKIEEAHHPKPDGILNGDIEGMHVDLPGLRQGGIKGVVSVHHLPEIGLLQCSHSLPVKLLGALVKGKLEAAEKGHEPFDQTMEMIQAFERAIYKAQGLGFPEVAIAHGKNEFFEALENNKIVFVHSLEGAHSLGTGSKHDLLLRLDAFFAHGVCQITLAHFFQNAVAASQGGIPPSTKKLLHYQEPKRDFEGLNPQGEIGEALVDRMFEKGIIVDLTHCTPTARDEVLSLNERRAAKGKPLRPVVISHTGLASVAGEGMKDEGDKLFLPSDDEVRRIIKTDGLIGVIFMRYWLDGHEEDSPKHFDKALPQVVETMQRIRHIDGGSCDHIAIGTDLDGFSQTPDDLVTEAYMPKLLDALAEGFSSNDIDKITHLNYMRVLRLGWGR